ncbi:MAG: alpha/beta fold hydrolase [Candidatus Heimdallarchaeota archaeon]
MPFIKVSQSRFFYAENKLQTIPVLFIHGWLGSSNEWTHQICYFNSKQHIIILDLPGFGKSSKPNMKYSIDFFSSQILEFLKILGYNEVNLVGHSLGGMIALNIAMKNINLVKKIVLISTSASFSSSYKDKFMLFWVNLIFKFSYRRFLKSIIRRIVSNTTENKVFKKLYLSAMKIPKSVVLSTFKNMTQKFHLGKKDLLISQPVLIIYGSEDKIITKPMFNNLSKLIPNSEAIIIENSPHRVMVQKHMKVNELIENFLKS